MDCILDLIRVQYESCFGKNRKRQIGIQNGWQSFFALSNQNDVELEQQKENAKNQNTFKAPRTWLKV